VQTGRLHQFRTTRSNATDPRPGLITTFASWGPSHADSRTFVRAQRSTAQRTTPADSGVSIGIARVGSTGRRTVDLGRGRRDQSDPGKRRYSSRSRRPYPGGNRFGDLRDRCEARCGRGTPSGRSRVTLRGLPAPAESGNSVARASRRRVEARCGSRSIWHCAKSGRRFRIASVPHHRDFRARNRTAGAMLVDRMTSDFSLGSVEVALSPLQRFEEFLQSRGKRMTKPQKLLIEHVFSRHDHFDADTLMEQLPPKGAAGRIGRATVYRTLNKFVEAGLLRSFTLDGRAVYEHDYGYPQHDHLHCTQCQRLFEFQSDQLMTLRDAVARENRFRVTGHRFIISGICENCQKSRRRTHRKLDMI